jgi:hypothetical protein
LYESEWGTIEARGGYRRDHLVRVRVAERETRKEIFVVWKERKLCWERWYPNGGIQGIGAYRPGREWRWMMGFGELKVKP